MMFRRLVIALALGLSLGAAPALAHEAHNKPAAAVTTVSHPNATGVMPEMIPATHHGEAATAVGPKPMPQRLYSWLGRWHPAVVHFPIALFLVAGVLELAALAGRRAWLTDGTRVLIGLAALCGLAAGGLGWLSMGLPGSDPDLTHTLHRWLGTAIAVAGLAVWWAKERSMHASSGRGSRRLYAGLLTIIFVGVLINAYLGGALTHGVNHMRF